MSEISIPPQIREEAEAINRLIDEKIISPEVISQTPNIDKYIARWARKHKEDGIPSEDIPKIRTLLGDKKI